MTEDPSDSSYKSRPVGTRVHIKMLLLLTRLSKTPVDSHLVLDETVGQRGSTVASEVRPTGSLPSSSSSSFVDSDDTETLVFLDCRVFGSERTFYFSSGLKDLRV